MTPRHDNSQPEDARPAGYEPPRVTPLGSVTDLTQGGGGLGGDAIGPGGSSGGSHP
jgi:hypothetical protein